MGCRYWQLQRKQESWREGAFVEVWEVVRLSRPVHRSSTVGLRSVSVTLRHPLQHETAADINQLLMTTLRVDTRGPGPP